MSKKEVINKWQTEGDLAVIYQVGDIILYFSKDKDPDFERGQTLNMEEAVESSPYKVAKHDFDQLPSDAFIDLGWSWSK